MARLKPAEVTEELGEVWRLIVGYTKQETTAPLRGLAAFMRNGIVGMVLFSIGTGFGVIAILRAFQSEAPDVVDGNFSFVPYVVALVWCGIVGVLAARSVARTPWKKREGDAK